MALGGPPEERLHRLRQRLSVLRKHTTNIMDATAETRSTTTDPLYAQAAELAGRVQLLVPLFRGLMREALIAAMAPPKAD